MLLLEGRYELDRKAAGWASMPKRGDEVWVGRMGPSVAVPMQPPVRCRVWLWCHRKTGPADKGRWQTCTGTEKDRQAGRM